MSEAKRPDPKRRPPASRPGRAGDAARERPRKPSVVRRGRNDPGAASESAGQPIKRSIAASAAQQSEQRLGFSARRAAILAAVVCVLTLTIAGPVRTYFAQRTEMKQLAAVKASLQQQIAELQQQQSKQADPAYIAAQARDRLGFVMPGETPYQVQVPPAPETPPQHGPRPNTPTDIGPWYTALWHTIADDPHGPPEPPEPVEPAPSPESPAPPSPVSPGG